MKKIVLKTIMLGDVEDPDLYVAQPIWEWQQTEQGAWAMKHGENMMFHRTIDYAAYANKYTITGEFSEEDYLYFVLRWGEPQR